jgi:hypothetical protein
MAGRRIYSQLFDRYWASVPTDVTRMNCRIYYHLLYLYSAAVRADDFQIPPHRQAVSVGSNSMTDTLIIQKATEELSAKTFGVTEQFLNIHQIVYENGKPKVARVDRESKDGTAIVYFPVKDEKFYLAVYVDTEPEISVRHVNTESYSSVYFTAISEDYSFSELSNMTKLNVTDGHNKGDKRAGNVLWKSSQVIFKPNPEADEFEDKLKKLLDFLEQDKDGVSFLVDKANGYIQVTSSFHNGNTKLGGHTLYKDIVKRMSNLNLAIDFDLYADGNFYKD